MTHSVMIPFHRTQSLISQDVTREPDTTPTLRYEMQTMAFLQHHIHFSHCSVLLDSDYTVHVTVS